MKNLIILSLVAALTFSCARSLDPLQDIATPKPTARTAQTTGIPLPTLKKGYAVYIRHCAQCHEHRLPTSADLPSYHQTIATMSHVADLAEDESAALQIYLEQFTDR